MKIPWTGLVLVLVSAVVAAGERDAELDAALARAAGYVAAYERDLVNIVGLETYEQIQVEGVDEAFLATSLTGELRPPPGVRQNRVETRSDYLLIRIEGFASRLGFRDVFEVNGKRIRDREQRFQKLLAGLEGSPAARWQALAEESARYNLGRVIRTVNTPTYALAVLRREAWPRFHYKTVDDAARVDGVRGLRVEFEEHRSPTLIRNAAGTPVYARGSVVIEPDSGRVLETELTTDDGKVRAWIRVAYRPEKKLDTWVPSEMRERYLSTAREYIECRARYARFRRFEVDVEAEIGP